MAVYLSISDLYEVSLNMFAEPRELIVVVMSQQDAFSTYHVERLENHLAAQVAHPQKLPVVHFLHKEFPEPGAWTVIPILPRLVAQHGHNSSWVIICEPRTRLELRLLVELLANYDSRTPMWIGHALYDREPTIIHHFALPDKHKFQYPNFATGFAMTMALVRKLVSRLNNGDWPQIDFSIDVSHELSLFIWDEGGGPPLTHTKNICITPAPNCALYPMPFTPCGEPISIQSIYFAVKTCSKFHASRVPVVLKTWARHAEHLTLFTDSPDPSIPQLFNLGIPNTEQGHCSKTMGIIHYVADKFRKQENLHWLVLADDDTIFSVARIQSLLSCYESDASLLALGERYGYRVRETHGYSYITGGGGTVLSRDAVLRLAAPGACDCPAPTAPDDMFMGLCLARLDIPIIHSPFFHQARPVDYAPEYLSAQHPVSFHKHWMIDPIKVYKKWFEEADQQHLSTHANVHAEL
ncbi:hypothetical protein B566_EDAN012120 [Ephemera danica]|nr:hypothetical protein B566_EDAN012120 [Ephemera danica]